MISVTYPDLPNPLPAPDPARQSDAPQDSRSTSIAVPYYPALKLVVGSVNAALVVSYLEMRYPSPPPEPGRRYGVPVTVDFARMADELAIDRRTCGLALLCISTWYASEIQRIGAVRAGREFLSLKHSRWPKMKLYSLVAAREWKSLRTLTLRKNWPLLTKTLADAGITSLCATPSLSALSPALQRHNLEKFAAQQPPLQGLTEILLRGVELAQDRRKTRYIRLRRAMKQSAEPVEVMKQPRKPSADDEALDQALGDELLARLSRRRR